MTKFDKVLAIASAMILVAMLLNGCATPWQGQPYGAPFKTFEPQSVEPQPGDEEIVETTIGQLRQALAVADQFDLLVPQYNETVGFANQIAGRYDALLEHDRKLYIYAKVAPWVGAGVGGIFTAFVLSLAR